MILFSVFPLSSLLMAFMVYCNFHMCLNYTPGSIFDSSFTSPTLGDSLIFFFRERNITAVVNKAMAMDSPATIRTVFVDEFVVVVG